MATSSLISAAFFIFLLTSLPPSPPSASTTAPLETTFSRCNQWRISSRPRQTIDSVKIFNVSPQILQAFAGSGTSVTITTPNRDIPALTNLDSACQWVVAHIKPFHPQTKIKYILVGSEVLHWTDWNTIKLLVPAMRTLHRALNAEGIRDINDPITSPPRSPTTERASRFHSSSAKTTLAQLPNYPSPYQTPPTQMVQMTPLKPCDDPIVIVSTMMQMMFFCPLSLSPSSVFLFLFLFPIVTL